MTKGSRRWRGAVFLLLAAAVSGVAAARGQAVEPARKVASTPPSAPAAPAIELRINPLMNLHAWVRQIAERRADAPDKPGAAEAVAAARRIGAELGGFLGWGILDGIFVGSDSSAQLAKALPEIEEEMQLRGGQVFHKRAALAELLAAYAKMEPWFLSGQWPVWKTTLEERRKELEKTFLPKLPAAWADVEKHLELPPPTRPIPVYLVYYAPFPGAVTQRYENGPYTWVAVGTELGEETEEAFLHESLHALDVLGEGKPNVLSRLRDRLQALPGASPREVHDFVHTLMFAQAAGTVRAVWDPKHRDYGDVAGYYPKVPRATAVVVPAWRAYLQGEISRDAALDKIAQGFAAPGAPPKPEPATPSPEKQKGDPQAAPVLPPGRE